MAGMQFDLTVQGEVGYSICREDNGRDETVSVAEPNSLVVTIGGKEIDMDGNPAEWGPKLRLAFYDALDADLQMELEE